MRCVDSTCRFIDAIVKPARVEEVDLRLHVSLQYLNGDLIPAMNDLEEANKQYMKWQEACAKCDTLDHVVNAWRYWRMCQARNSQLSKAQKVLAELEEHRRESRELEVWQPCDYLHQLEVTVLNENLIIARKNGREPTWCLIRCCHM